MRCSPSVPCLAFHHPHVGEMEDSFFFVGRGLGHSYRSTLTTHCVNWGSSVSQESCVGSVFLCDCWHFCLAALPAGGPALAWRRRILCSRFFLGAGPAPAIRENLFWRNSVNSQNSKGYYTRIPAKYWVLGTVYVLFPLISSRVGTCEVLSLQRGGWAQVEKPSGELTPHGPCRGRQQPSLWRIIRKSVIGSTGTLLEKIFDRVNDVNLVRNCDFPIWPNLYPTAKQPCWTLR